MKHILVVVGDIGGAKAVEPVVRRLQQETECNVRILADPAGKGKDVLGDLPYETYQEGWLEGRATPDLALIGTSATAHRAQRAITEAYKDNRLVAWLEDFWGAANVPAVQNLTPNFLFTIDKDTPPRRWSKTITTGNPAFDRLSSWNIQYIRDVRTEVREKLGIPDSEKVVTFFGPGFEPNYPFRLLEAMAMLLPSIHEAGATFLPLFHPKDEVMSGGLAQMMSGWDFARIRLDAREHENDMERLVAASDVVTSIDGTALLIACLLRIPALAAIGLQSAAYLKSRGLEGPDYLPCITNRSVALARQMEITPEIVACSSDATGRYLHSFHSAMRGRQAGNYPNDGQATERVVGAIKNILGLA